MGKNSWSRRTKNTPGYEANYCHLDQMLQRHDETKIVEKLKMPQIKRNYAAI